MALHPGPLLLRLPDGRLRLCLHENRRCGCWRWGPDSSSRTPLHPGPLPLRCHDERLRLWLRKTWRCGCGLGLGHVPSRGEPRRTALHPRPLLFGGSSLGQQRRGRGRRWRNPRHRHAQSAESGSQSQEASIIGASGFGADFGSVVSVGPGSAGALISMSCGGVASAGSVDLVHVFSPHMSHVLQPLSTICRLETSVSLTSV